MSKLLNISQVSKILNLIHPKTKKPQNHIIRYWESVFVNIRPKKINNRRYYTLKQIEEIKAIKFLLKNEGMTVSGVKKLINSNVKKLDYHNIDSLKNNYYKKSLKIKSRKLLDKINKIKAYGKKNSS
tara:strand:+ start:8176 stop:8556 length:381 start_codon:yes stop_codon:yes gene_type:complete